AVGDGRVGGIALVRAFAGIVMLGEDRFEFLRPENSPVTTIDAQQMPAEVFLLAGFLRVHPVTGVASHIDALADDDRAGRTGARQLPLPRDIVLRRPLDRQPFFVAEALASRPAKLAPIGA